MKIDIRENEKKIINGLIEEDVIFLSRVGKINVRKLLGNVGDEIQPFNVAGAVRLPSGIQINISPKIPIPNLLRMMSHVGELYSPLADVDFAKDHSLFDILALIFAREFGDLLRVGMKQSYSTDHQVLSALKGQLAFSDSIGMGLIGSGKMACRFEKLSLDSPMNRAILSAAMIILRSLMASDNTKVKVRRCLNQIPYGMIRSDFREEDFNAIQIDRTSASYKKILFLSKLIISNVSYSNRFGENRFPGFLIDVAKLFEKYVAKSLQSYQDLLAYKVTSQESSHLDNRREVVVKPDLIFTNDSGVMFVADTKYKDFSDLKFENEDIYQMLAYLLRHRCREGLLIYPSFDPNRVGMVKSIRITSELGEISIHGICVDLTDPSSVAICIRDTLKKFDSYFAIGS